MKKLKLLSLILIASALSSSNVYAAAIKGLPMSDAAKWMPTVLPFLSKKQTNDFFTSVEALFSPVASLSYMDSDSVEHEVNLTQAELKKIFGKSGNVVSIKTKPQFLGTSHVSTAFEAFAEEMTSAATTVGIFAAPDSYGNLLIDAIYAHEDLLRHFLASAHVGLFARYADAAAAKTDSAINHGANSGSLIDFFKEYHNSIALCASLAPLQNYMTNLPTAFDQSKQSEKQFDAVSRSMSDVYAQIKAISVLEKQIKAKSVSFDKPLQPSAIKSIAEKLAFNGIVTLEGGNSVDAQIIKLCNFYDPNASKLFGLVSRATRYRLGDSTSIVGGLRSSWSASPASIELTNLRSFITQFGSAVANLLKENSKNRDISEFLEAFEAGLLDIAESGQGIEQILEQMLAFIFNAGFERELQVIFNEFSPDQLMTHLNEILSNISLDYTLQSGEKGSSVFSIPTNYKIDIAQALSFSAQCSAKISQEQYKTLLTALTFFGSSQSLSSNVFFSMSTSKVAQIFARRTVSTGGVLEFFNKTLKNDIGIVKGSKDYHSLAISGPRINIEIIQQEESESAK